MKYLKYFENDIQLKLWNDLPIKYKDETVFHNNNWLVVKPKKFETLLDLSEGTEWSILNIRDKYYAGAFKPENYQMNDNIYVNINKKTGSKLLFDFYKSHFYDNDQEDIYLKDFFDNNKDLFNFYGEVVECSNIIKDGNDYWIVVDDNEWFADFYEIGNGRNDVSEKFIKSVLSDDAYEFFEHYEGVDLDEYGIDADDDTLILMKVILLLEKEKSDYDYEIEDISDYDDVVDIAKENDIDELKDLLIRAISDAKSSAEESEAFEQITDAFYDFFNLEVGSAKWENYKNSKYHKLFIKFKSKESAYYAKFRIIGYDNSYYDDKIEYSSPYYGYSGDDKVKNKVFNSQIFDRISEYFNNYEVIDKYYKLWKLIKTDDPKIDEEEILKKIKLQLDMERYNI
jgi:hypothetical protein